MKNFSIEIENVYLDDYLLDSQNILKISTYNSIDQIGYTLEMVYNDITDIKTKIPLKGTEELKIVMIDIFKNKIKKSFILRTVKRLNDPQLENNTIHMTFISKDAFYLGINRVYFSYQDTISNIIKKWIPEIEDNIPTTENCSIIIPGFTKTKGIKYLRQFTDNYFVFENNEKFQHSSIQDLLIKSNDIYKFQSNNRKDRYYIIDSKEIRLFDTVTETYENMYNNIYKAYNPKTKVIESKTKQIDSIQKELKTLGSGENFVNNLLNGLDYKITMYPYFENVLENSKVLDLMFNKSYELLLNGDLNLQVGKTINLQFDNKLTNGLYLITKVAHHIDGKDFYTKIEVKKNAYYKGDIISNVVL